MPDPFSPDTIQDEEATVTLEDLVGEGRKYKDPNELAKAYNNADSYIQKLKADKLAAEAEAKVLKDLVEARSKTPIEEKQTEAVRTEPPEQQKQTDQKIDLNELVRQELASASEEKRKSDNINRAAEALNNHYGSAAKAQEAIKARADQLGVKFEWLRDVASDSPQALFATMGITPNAQSRPTPGYSPDVNINVSRTNVKNFEYFENIRKADVKLYNSPEIRKQMFDSARELGDKFYAR